ncbi:MAG: carboxypeptidase regulatory-like domain-containing protein [Pyrinomonadaceae bacterium]
MKNLSLLKRLGIFSIVALYFVLFNVNANAQTTIVNYDFNAATTTCTANPTSTATGVTSVYSASETTCAISTGTATDANAFTQNATAGTTTGFSNSSGTNTKFFQFSLSGASLNTYSSYKVYFQSQRSATGAQTITLSYSTDGGTSFNNFPTTQTVSTAFSTTTPEVFDLSGITALNNKTNIIFRLSVSGATGTGTIRIDNFQVQALAPTAAGATINGRITDPRGRGLKHVVVMLAGGALEEPIYATTSAFGYYRFEDIPTGNTYVLTVFSRTYTFDQSSMVINLNNDFSDGNFIGQTRFSGLKGQ